LLRKKLEEEKEKNINSIHYNAFKLQHM